MKFFKHEKAKPKEDGLSEYEYPVGYEDQTRIIPIIDMRDLNEAERQTALDARHAGVARFNSSVCRNPRYF